MGWLYVTNTAIYLLFSVPDLSIHRSNSSTRCTRFDRLLSNIKECIPQRRLTKTKRKRDVSRYYYLKKQNEKIRVCEKFFKATLSISNGPILKALKGAGLLGNFEGQDNRGNYEPHNKINQEDGKLCQATH